MIEYMNGLFAPRFYPNRNPLEEQRHKGMQLLFQQRDRELKAQRQKQEQINDMAKKRKRGQRKRDISIGRIILAKRRKRHEI